MSAVPIPPCACCGETNDLHPIVWLRDGFRVTGPSASYHGQMECWVCGGRGPRGTGATPDAAVRDALTRAQVEADRHRAWVAAGRPALPHEAPDAAAGGAR